MPKKVSSWTFQMSKPAELQRKRCQPLCTRWLYPVLSASYGYINTPSQASWYGSFNETASWSRTRIYFPEAYYQLNVEKAPTQRYLAMCDVGGVFGVYLGFSVITVIQFAHMAFL